MLNRMNLLYVVLFFLQYELIAGVVINTGSGKLLGTTNKTSVGKKTYYAFKSIRYAEPPERFEAPVPVKAWRGVYDATDDLVTCYQFVSTKYPMSEDCLYLSVYTPELPTENKTTKIPVMIWISGGFFIIGNNLYESYTPDHLLDENVIVVSINYRLGAFGFLSTGDGVIPGNNGIKDVLLAIEWVHENIQYFGGDPNKVTLVGQSAGAAIISYLTFSEATKNKGYFQKIILQSGSGLHPFAYQRNPRKSFNLLKTLTGCITQQIFGDYAVKNCLKRVPPLILNTLTAPSTAILSFWNVDILNGLPFAPVMEKPSSSAVITMETYNTLNDPDGKPLDNIKVFMGTNSEEGAIFDSIIILLRPVILTQLDLNNNEIVPDDMFIDPGQKTHVASLIKKKYFKNGIYLLAPNNNIIKFISDNDFNKPLREYLSLVKNKVPTYCYIFSYPGKMGGSSVSTNQYPDTERVGHGAEIFYLFDSSFQTAKNFDPQDFVVRKRMLKIWTNFVKTGNPTPIKDNLLENIQVPSLTGPTTRCLNINGSLGIIENPKQDGYMFWKNLYNTYGDPRDTY